MKKNFVWLLAFVVIFCACETQSSDDVAVSAIWQDYLYYFNKSDNKTHALAEFRDGGSIGNDVILYAPSGIQMNGQKLNYSAIPYDLFYHHYGEVLDGRVNVGSYVFTDKNGKTYKNTADISKMDIDFPSGLTEISKGADFVFTWQGAAIGENETIGLTFTIVQDTSGTANYFSADTQGASSLTLKVSDLSVLIAGTQQIKLSRIRTASLQAATAKGGEIETGFILYQNVEIKD